MCIVGHSIRTTVATSVESVATMLMTVGAVVVVTDAHVHAAEIDAGAQIPATSHDPHAGHDPGQDPGHDKLMITIS